MLIPFLNPYVYSTVVGLGVSKLVMRLQFLLSFIAVFAISPVFRWVMISIFVFVLHVVMWSMTVLFENLGCFLVLRRRSPESVGIEQISPDSGGREIPWVKPAMGIVFAVYVIASLEHTVRRSYIAMMEQRLVGIGRELGFLVLAPININNRYYAPNNRIVDVEII